MKYTLAAMVSIIGILASYFVLRPEQWAQQQETEQVALAKLEDSNNDVKRKSRGKLIWLSIKDGDELYKGDVVQTSKASSASIKFLDTESSINIEPDTTIVVEKVDNNINLDVLEGGLFVKNSAKDSSIKVKSGNKTVDISKGDASFSIDDSGSLGVKVHSGSAKANVGGRTVALGANEIGQLSDKGINKRKEKFLELTPLYGQSLYLPPGSNRVSFKWRKFKSDWDIELSVGRSTKLLKKINKDKIVSFKKGELTAQIEKGEVFWQLKGYDPTGKEKPIQSEIYKVNLLTKLAPSLVYPGDKEVLKFKKDDKRTMSFQWADRSPLERSLVQVSRDPKFSKVIFEKVATGNELKIASMKREGHYYWRVKGYLKGSNQSITSDNNHFEVKFFENIISPSPYAPENGETVSLTEKQKNASITFKWNKVDTARSYQFNLVKENSNFKFQREVKKAQFRLKGLKEGSYTWKIASIDNKKQKSEYSEESKLTIRKQGLIFWQVENNNYEYINNLPEIKVAWSKQADDKNWLLTISDTEDFKNKRNFDLTKNDWVFRPKRDGTYYLKVISKSKDNKVLSKSDVLNLSIGLKPLPTAPRFSKKMPKALKASKNGFLPLSFVKDKKEKSRYQIKLTNLNGEVVRQVIFQSEKGVLKSLMPGRYWVSAQKQDIHGRVGPSSESRELSVPKESQVKAPKIDNIMIR